MEEDMAYALALQRKFDSEQISDRKENCRPSNPCTSVSIVDDSWELIDPLPDIRQLFLQFNDAFFQGKLAGIEVKWSPRMTLCAGLCCYEGRGGLCSIRLSQPLLKLRPRRDLVQTLLHEMIHALLFVTHNNKDHDAHGPEFHKHMNRINKETGANITVYHNFHDEVNVYRQHWWKCNGPCQKRPPYYGIVRRAMNRAPSSRDTWWADHQRQCGGSYTKIKEPDGYSKKKTATKDRKGETKDTKSSGVGTLPKFFEAGKKGDGNRKKAVTDNGDSDSSVSSDVGQEKHKADENVSIIPFSGIGHVLGTKVAPHRGVAAESGLHSSSQETTTVKPNKTAHKRPVEPPTRVIKNPSPRKRKRLDSPPELTIIEAFKRGGDKGETVLTSSSTSNPTPGSYGKPINILDDASHRLQLESVSCKEQVPCPVCGTLVPVAQINHHLDSCLG